MTWIIWLGLALGTIAAVTVGLAAYGAARWADSTKRLVLRLENTRLPATTSRYDTRELQGLPAPVERAGHDRGQRHRGDPRSQRPRLRSAPVVEADAGRPARQHLPGGRGQAMPDKQNCRHVSRL